MEAPIVFGLKRPASERLVAGAGTGQRSDEGGTAVRVAALCVAAVAPARRSSGWLASWAAGRSISPNSLSGISLLLALCAAAWFSGGAHDGGWGTIAMLGWLLVLIAARGLAAGEAGSPGATASSGTAPGFGWLSAVGAAAAECAIYGGMAAGGKPTILVGIWPLAVTTVISIAIAELLSASWQATLRAGVAGEPGRLAAVRHPAGRILGLPPGLRGLLALLAFAIAGVPAALFAVLALEVVAVGTAIALLAKITPAAGAPGQASAQNVNLALRDDGAVARWAGRLVQGNLIPLPPAFGGLIATAMLAALGLRNLPGFIALTPPVVMMLAAPGSSHRHDGRFDWLAPVLLALAQYVYLATLGFARGVPGPVVFTACALIGVWYAGIVASPGRDGAGRAGPGTGPTDTEANRGGAWPAHGAFLGWETRMFAVGLAAALGLATFGYLGLAAYLGVLICRRVMTG